MDIDDDTVDPSVVATQQPEKQTPEEREAAITEGEKQLVKRLTKQIDAQKSSPGYKRARHNIDKNRIYATGEQHSESEISAMDDEGVVRANLILPELKKALIETYARNPDFSVEPTKAVPQAQYAAWRDVGQTAERLLDYQFSPAQADLKSAVKRAVRAADTTAIGWIKVVYQQHIEKDPLIEQRLSDVQDDLQRLDRLIAETSEDKKGEVDYESKRIELQEQINTLESEVEVKRTEGFVLSPRETEHVIVSSDATSPEDYGKASWIVDEIWLTVEVATDRFGWVPPSATRFSKKSTDSATTSKAADACDEDMLVCVYEMWRLTDRKIYTMMVGFAGFIRPPYTPKKVGERFHGLFPLYFDSVNGVHHPVALVTQLRSLQDEHTTTRTNFREHRERAVPFNVTNGQALGKTSVEKLTNPQFFGNVVVEDLDPSIPIETVFKSVQHPAIDPSVYSTDHVRVDWEQVTRRGETSRGVSSRAKTAAEAEIMQSNLNMDQSERQDVVEDFLREVAQYCLEIMLNAMTPEQVKRIAGPEAQWPQLTKDDTFNMVTLTIRAGSTGKPNLQENLDKWVKILPEIRDTLLAVVELRTNGKQDEARIQMALLKESLRRFDERLNVDELMPEQTDEDLKALSDQQTQLAEEQRQQLAVQMRKIVSEIANLDADTTKKIAEAEAQEAGQQIDLYMGVLDLLVQKQQGQAQSPSTVQ